MAKPTPKPRRLGRGLSSLIQPTEPVRVDADQTNTKQTTSSGDPTDPASGAASGGAGAAVGESGGLVRWVAVGRIEPSPFQPRRHFDEGALAQLAASITRSGLMQPIIVRPTAAGFELVAGEPPVESRGARGAHRGAGGRPRADRRGGCGMGAGREPAA
ncbi:MAG: ParB N-terminal domain-containing protein [Planctomycetota bacterium]|nr:MAG: ParB N-terminal domain-containing protein [Planctomycetota bacterium]